MSASVRGKSNHFSRTVSLTSGVAMLTSATPSATQTSPQRAHACALSRSGPSVRSTARSRRAARNRRQARRHQESEAPISGAGGEARDVATKHEALCEARERRGRPEEPVPELAMPAFRLDAKLERDAAQHEANQHRRHRQ